MFGCGGDRDPGKRPQMGAQARADVAVVTSDNPRSRSAQAIIADILAGMSAPGHVDADRARAIDWAIARRRRDIVLIAGKGPRGIPGSAGVETAVFDFAVPRGRLSRWSHNMTDVMLTTTPPPRRLTALPAARTSALIRVTTDSRAVQAGDLFVALKGERFDAHDFVKPWLLAASAASVRSIRELPGASLIRVEDTWRPWAGWRRFGARWEFCRAHGRHHRQQRQDQRQEMLRAILVARESRRRRRAGHCWQSEQRHRRAADPVAPARGHRYAVIDGHEPSRRNPLSGRLARPMWWPSTTPSAPAGHFASVADARACKGELF